MFATQAIGVVVPMEIVVQEIVVQEIVVQEIVVQQIVVQEIVVVARAAHVVARAALRVAARTALGGGIPAAPGVRHLVTVVAGGSLHSVRATRREIAVLTVASGTQTVASGIQGGVRGGVGEAIMSVVHRRIALLHRILLFPEVVRGLRRCTEWRLHLHQFQLTGCR